MNALLETDDYRRFTTPAELHKAINTLKGLVAGINSEDGANENEIAELMNWCSIHKHLGRRHPFSELLGLIEAANEDGVVTTDEAQDILWLCNNFMSDSTYYDAVTSALQYLMGLLHGILADGDLSDHEISSLRRWMDAHDHLRGCYPFDEIDSLLISVLADKKIDENERDTLKAFFSNFIDLSASYNLNASELADLRNQYQIQGVCAVCPDIQFRDRLFCFTGKSYRSNRDDIAALITDNGGEFSNRVTKKTNYLVVGNAGNPCWAYACYGRKIEEAVELRKQGHKIVIVNETDFWDAID